MIILLSPTKKQVRHPHNDGSALLFNDTKEQILDHLKSFDETDIKSRYKISDSLTQKTFTDLHHYQENSIALYTYTGEAFKSLDAKTIPIESAQKHLRIFSALYGLLEPTHLISEYRLDMLTRLDFNLYDLWRPIVTEYLNNLNQPIVNLASQEFFNIIDTDAIKVPIYHVLFLNENHKVVSAQAKKARGAFTRELLISQQFKLDQVEIEDYTFSHKENNTFIYIRNT